MLTLYLLTLYLPAILAAFAGDLHGALMLWALGALAVILED